MCATYNVVPSLEELLAKMGIDPEAQPCPPEGLGEAKPTSQVAVVLRAPESGELALRFPRWGLVPPWADDPRFGTRTFNARAETLAEKPAFRAAFRKRRCLLPLESFFEYDSEFRYRISTADGSPLVAAGLWEAKGDLLTCTMVTTAPNEAMAKVHDRMPAFLLEADWAAWMDAGVEDPRALAPLLAPVDAGLLRLERDGERAAKGKTRSKARVTDEPEPFAADQASLF